MMEQARLKEHKINWVSRFRYNGKTLWRSTGFMVSRKHGNHLGNAFKFQDLNPHVEFTTVLSAKDCLLLAWFFFSSAFKKEATDDE